VRPLVLAGLLGALLFVAVVLTFTPLPSQSAKNVIRVLDKAEYVAGTLTLCLFADMDEKYVATVQVLRTVLFKVTPHDSLTLLVEVKACDIESGRCSRFTNMGSLGEGTYRLYVRAIALPGEVCISFMPVG